MYSVIILFRHKTETKTTKVYKKKAKPLSLSFKKVLFSSHLSMAKGHDYVFFCDIPFIIIIIII